MVPPCRSPDLNYPGRRGERVIGRWGGNRPLQAFGPFPDLSTGPPSSTDAFDQQDQEQKLCRSKQESPDTRYLIEVRKLQRIVGNTPWHSRQTHKVHRKKGQVDANEREPEMGLAQRLVVHVAGPLG